MAWLEELDPMYRNGAVVLMLSFMVYLGAKLILRKFYRLAQNTRDFSHEMNRLRARGAF